MRAIIKSAAMAGRYAFGWLLLAVIVVFLAWLRGCSDAWSAHLH
jgi:hypothetical protein